MKIKNAQAGLILRDVVITELSVKNHLAAHGRFDENTHTIDMDYNVVDLDDSNENFYRAKLELITKVIVKNKKTTIFNLKVKHLDFGGSKTGLPINGGVCKGGRIKRIGKPCFLRSCEYSFSYRIDFLPGEFSPSNDQHF